jgi:hypothetical protein
VSRWLLVYIGGDMGARLNKRKLLGIGEIVLLTYLIVVIMVALAQALMGWPSVNALASSPVLLAQGQWWRLVTSALVVQGPPVPQIIAIAALGSLGIYFGGSWLFWRTAVAGHIFGTLVAYVWFGGLWLLNAASVSRYLTNPDYGVSLIWCAALGAFAAWAWCGQRADLTQPERPVWALSALGVLVVVAAYSDPMAAVQHVVAFAVGFGIIATAGRSRILHRRRRPIIGR